MYNLHFTVIALTFSFALNGVVFARSISAHEYFILEESLEVECCATKVRHTSLAGSENNQYVAEAKKTKTWAEPSYLVSMHKWMVKAVNNKVVSSKSTKSAKNKKKANPQTLKKLPKSDISIDNRLRDSNPMPIIDELSPPFKKSRLM